MGTRLMAKARARKKLHPTLWAAPPAALPVASPLSSFSAFPAVFVATYLKHVVKNPTLASGPNICEIGVYDSRAKSSRSVGIL